MTETMDQVMDCLESMGLIARWWCDACQDKVPYRTLEMTEADSRRAHDADHHPTVEAGR